MSETFTHTNTHNLGLETRTVLQWHNFTRKGLKLNYTVTIPLLYLSIHTKCPRIYGHKMHHINYDQINLISQTALTQGTLVLDESPAGTKSLKISMLSCTTEEHFFILHVARFELRMSGWVKVIGV